LTRKIIGLLKICPGKVCFLFKASVKRPIRSFNAIAI